MVKFVLKKYYPVVLALSAFTTIIIVVAGNPYISSILTLTTFLIIPYYVTRHAFVEAERMSLFINSYAKAGFLSGGVMNLLLSLAGVLESIREMFMTIQGLSTHALTSYGQSYYDIVFSGVFSIGLFPVVTFFIGGLAGFVASCAFHKN